MQFSKILCILAVYLICVDARGVKRQHRNRQRSVSAPIPCNCPIEIPCGCKSLDPTYGGIGTCNCQNIFLDELSNCGCGKYVDSYGILNPELSNYGRVPAIKLPKTIASYDTAGPVPAINLPGLYDLVVDLPSCQCQPMAPYIIDLPSCPCQGGSYQIVDSPCSCRSLQTPFVDYLPFEVPSPMLTVPYAEPYYIQGNCQPQTQLPTCGCQALNTPCRCDSGIKVSYGLPCCQNSMSCGCQNPISCCQNSISCGCQNPIICGCDGVIQYGPQLPALEAPCTCQVCQLAPVELPVYGYGCQSLPPPVIGCESKYLRQVTLQPPFL